MEKTCGNCRFRGDALEVFGVNEDKQLPSGFFACELIKHRAQHYIGSSDIGEISGEQDAKKAGAFLADASGYHAALCVADDFACNRWEAKP
jgi:hypothetical protein